MRRIVQNISVISIACVAIFTQGRVQFETLQQATETYISCEKDAKQLQSGSDYLTEQVRMVVMTSDLRYTIEGKISAINEQLARPEDGMPKVSLSVGVAFADRPNPGESLSRTPTRPCITRRNTAATAARSTATKAPPAQGPTRKSKRTQLMSACQPDAHMRGEGPV